MRPNTTAGQLLARAVQHMLRQTLSQSRARRSLALTLAYRGVFRVCLVPRFGPGFGAGGGPMIFLSWSHNLTSCNPIARTTSGDSRRPSSSRRGMAMNGGQERARRRRRRETASRMPKPATKPRESAPRRIRIGNMVPQRSGPTNVPCSNLLNVLALGHDRRRPVAG